MTDLRTAAQQALEAYDAHEPLAVVMEELRAALAEPAQELASFAALVATAERERIIAENAPVIEKINAHIKALEDELAAIRARSNTAPPQRKPLTEEEIGKVAAPYYGTMGFRVEAFARAIERAHGIGGKDE